MKTSSNFILGFFVYSLTLAVLFTALSFWWASTEFEKPGPLTETLLFEVPKGSGLSSISDELAADGAIHNSYIFMFGTRLMGVQADLKAGEYEFEPAISAYGIMDKLRKGDVVDRRVTIREGLTSYEVTEILKSVKKLEGDITAVPEEGTLLPQTYDYRLHETRDQILERMKADMIKTIDELWPDRAQNLPITTPQEAITLASIVEKETGVPEERKRVAGVFINRLKKGIALQTDPTVIYGITMGKHKNDGQGPLGRRLLIKDLEKDTPYNTYTRPGLPPGPIANPGRAAIEAVLHPEEHEFIYFVADGSGGHVFAKTLDEHNANVAKWQKIRRESARKAKEEKSEKKPEAETAPKE
jgi:UPF0755 protein